MIQSSDFFYCDSSFPEMQEVVKSLNKTYSGLSVNDLLPLYRSFQKNFYKDEDYKIEVLNRDKIFSGESLEKLNVPSEFWDASFTVGIDIPVWLTPRSGFNGKFLMMVAEDPLRSVDFKEVNQRNEIVISTPFGTHLAKRRRGPHSLMWKIAFNFLSKGYGLYFTDANKLWIGINQTEAVKKDSKAKGSKVALEGLLNAFEDTLNAEINCIDPKVILTFGGVAKIIMNGKYSDKKKEFPHSAARAISWRSILDNEKASHQNIVDAVNRDVCKLLL